MKVVNKDLRKFLRSGHEFLDNFDPQMVTRLFQYLPFLFFLSFSTLALSAEEKTHDAFSSSDGFVISDALVSEYPGTFFTPSNAENPDSTDLIDSEEENEEEEFHEEILSFAKYFGAHLIAPDFDGHLHHAFTPHNKRRQAFGKRFAHFYSDRDRYLLNCAFII